MGSVLAFRPIGSMESKPSSLGAWLREKRLAAGLSLQDVADRAGVSKQYVNTIEREVPHPESKGKPRPTQKVVDGLAKAVGAPIAEARLIAGYAPPETGPADVAQSRLLFYFNDLAEPARSDALAMLEALWRSQHARQKAANQQEQPPKKKMKRA